MKEGTDKTTCQLTTEIYFCKSEKCVLGLMVAGAMYAKLIQFSALSLILVV